MHRSSNPGRCSLDLTQKLYASIVDQEPWQYFLNAVQVATSSNSAAVMLSMDNDNNIDYINVSDIKPLSADAVSFYRTKAAPLDPFLNIPEGEAVTIHEYIGERMFVSSEYYKSYLSASSEYFIMGVDVRTRGGARARLRVCRDRHVQDFDSGDKEVLTAVAAHLQVAADIFCRLNHLQTERRAFVEGLDRTNLATFVLDQSGRVLSTNMTGTALLAMSREIRLHNGRVVIDHGPANRRLRSLLAGGAQSGAFELLSVPLSDGTGNMGIALKGLQVRADRSVEQAPALAMYVTNPSAPFQASGESISKLFGLTRAESSLAIALLEGYSLIEAAHQQGIAHNTARRHLHSIFDKVGVCRQGELIRVLMQSTAAIALN